MRLFFQTNSIAGIFIAAFIALLFSGLSQRKKTYRWLMGFLLTVLFVLLVKSNSRAGWLGLFCGITYTIYNNLGGKRTKRNFRIITPLCFLGATMLLMKYKQGSTSGRRHIYSLSLNMLENNWVSGIGFKQFRARLNEEQAAWFSAHNIDSKTALLADNTFFAFNDYLQWIIETGIGGFAGLFLFLCLLYRRVSFLKNEVPQSKTITAATSALICIGVAALFSYPMQVMAIQAMALVCLGILMFYPVYRHGSVNRAGRFIAMCLFIALSIYFVADSTNVIWRKREGKKAFELALTGYRKDAIKKYEEIIRKNPGNGAIMYSYAEQLYYCNRLPEALAAANKAIGHYADNKLYLLKAKIEDELNMPNEAEASYLHAIYMVPNRMASRFDLMNFYLSRNDTVKAVQWANSVLNMPVKIPSERTATMLKQARALLQQIMK